MRCKNCGERISYGLNELANPPKLKLTKIAVQNKVLDLCDDCYTVEVKA